MSIQEYFMREAIQEAFIARGKSEVPIGAVVVHQNEIIGRGHNQRETKKNALLHAEIMAIEQACHHLGAWRLSDCTLYVTLEPCSMCAGAIMQARISKVVYGAPDQKAGCAGTLLNLLDDPRFNHQSVVISGVLESECSQILKDFFRNLRNKK